MSDQLQRGKCTVHACSCCSPTCLQKCPCCRLFTVPALAPCRCLAGLHPFFDDRVNDLLDFKIYLDISGEALWCTDKPQQHELAARALFIQCWLDARRRTLPSRQLVGLSKCCPSTLRNHHQPPAPPPADEIKFAWKIQRDMAERGHSLESIKVRIHLMP